VDCITNVPGESRGAGLWRNANFLKLWTGQTISEMGSRITREGLPLTAVLVLGAKPAEMGLLAAVGAASGLLFGLLAGVWADRFRRRPIMIAADLARAALLASIPVAAYAQRLSMIQLYVVIALAGFCTVFFDVAYQSYLPSLVKRDNLLEGNSKLAQSSAIAEIAGPSLTGVLVQLITAPIAILYDALSFLVSALSVWLIRKPEPEGNPPPSSHHFREETTAGLRFIFGHPMLRPIACYSATGFFFFGFVGSLYVLFAIRELHMPPAALGAVIAVGGAGALIGAGLAPRLGRIIGLGRTFIGSVFVVVTLYSLIVLAHGPLSLAVSFLAVQQLFGDMSFAVFNVNELALRQSVAPEEVLGRVNGAMQLLTRGIYPLGALAGGVLAQTVGIRETLLIGLIGVGLSSVWLIASPLRNLREIPSRGRLPSTI
jgi:predicted MFS family arabinose efflux permease